MSTSLFASAQSIIIDDCNTGPFAQSGSGSQNDIPTSGAIGGTRDISISNATSPFAYMSRNTSTGYLTVNPYNNLNYGASPRHEPQPDLPKGESADGQISQSVYPFHPHAPRPAPAADLRPDRFGNCLRSGVFCPE